MAIPQPPAPAAPVVREPAHLVSRRAIPYWRLTSVIATVFWWIVLGVGFYFWPDRPWWGTTLIVAAALLLLPWIAFAPQVRYRIHRWEVTADAIYTRSGLLTIEQRIAPLSRVQTVDSQASALMRLFGLASITVTTASAAGPVTITCLDADVASRVVADLTAITAATEGDAT